MSGIAITLALLLSGASHPSAPVAPNRCEVTIVMRWEGDQLVQDNAYKRCRESARGALRRGIPTSQEVAK